MTIVRIKYDPEGVTKPDKCYTEKSDRCALDIILDELPLIPMSYLFATLNGKKLSLPVVDKNGNIADPGDEEALTRPLSKNESLKVMCTQKGSVTVAVLSIIKPVKKALSWIYKAPSYSASTDLSSVSGSSKDALEGQKNSTGLYKAIPDRYGQGVIFPNLIDNEYHSVYSSNNQTITQFMCIGQGEYDWDDIYLGDTQIGLVSGATATAYEPVDGVTTISDYFYNRSVTQVSRSNLDGPGYQKTALPSNSENIFFTYDSTNNLGRIDVRGNNANPVFNNYFSVGDSVTIGNADSILGSGSFDYTVDTNNDGEIDENDELQFTGVTYDLSGIYTVSEVSDTYIVFSSVSTVNAAWSSIDSNLGTGETSYQQDSSSATINLQKNSTSLTYQGPFYTSTPARGFMLDFGFYSGLKGTVVIRVEYTITREIGGAVIKSGSFDITYTASTLDQTNYTYSFNHGDIDDNEYYFGVKVSRTTAESTDGARPDTVKWDRFAAFAQFKDKKFTQNATFLKVVVPYSSSAISPSSNKVNLLGTRKTVTYDVSTGNVVSTLNPKTSFADALLHLYTVIHKRSASELDLDSLYEISNRIGSPLNLFSYTFDDLNQSLRDKMTLICNVARVAFVWDGKQYRFYRNEKKDTSQANLIARTDIAHPDVRDYSRSFNPDLPTAYDSVKLEYIFPDRNNDATYIRLKFDENGNISEGLGVNPYKITLSGCRNTEQAKNRAHLEIRQLLYQNWSVQDTLMKSGYLLDVGDPTLYSDVFRSDVYSGEILNVTGSVITLSKPVTLEKNVSYEIRYNDDTGDSHGPFSLVNGDGQKTRTVNAVNATDLQNAYTRSGVMGSDIQVGSRFSINKVSDGPQELFVITKKEGVDDVHVNITMSQYDDRTFEYDS